MKKNRKEGSLHVAKVLVPIIAMAVLSAVVLIERGGIRLKDNTGLKAPENLVIPSDPPTPWNSCSPV